MKKILVVDDEPEVLASLCEALRSAGYAVLEAQCGATALKAAEDPDIGVLVTDVAMWPVTGIDLARNVAAICPGVSVIFISGGAGSEQLAIADTPAFPWIFLAKPFSREDLISAVVKMSAPAARAAPIQ